MEPFSLRKVVCPHKNMPEEIKDSFFEAVREWMTGNGSYTEWTVGRYQDLDEDDAVGSEGFRKEVDDWAMKHFVKGEEIIILHWW